MTGEDWIRVAGLALLGAWVIRLQARIARLEVQRDEARADSDQWRWLYGEARDQRDVLAGLMPADEHGQEPEEPVR